MSSSFPMPLTEEDEISCLEKLSSGDMSARETLIKHNLRLVAHIAKKYTGTGQSADDLISIGTIGLIKGIDTYSSNRSTRLATYVSRCIENEILMYIRKRSASRCEVSLDEPLNIDWDGNELLLSDVLGSDDGGVGEAFAAREEKRVIHEAVAGLEPRERQIIELRFGLSGKPEMTQKDVADLLGISQSYISRLEKKIIARLREELTGKI